VQGRKASSATWRTKTVAGSKNKWTVSGLVAGTDYVWRIRTVCDPAGTPSTYSPEQMFSTPVLRNAAPTEPIASVQVYPNPVTDQVNVALQFPESLHNQAVVIRIIGVGGNVLATSNLNASSGTVTASFEAAHYPVGLYHVVWTSGTLTGSQAFVVQR
jgi:hypothetical protein